MMLTKNHISDLSTLQQYLRDYKKRKVDSYEDRVVSKSFDKLKDIAVKEGKEELAKLLWCLAVVQHIQNQFHIAFQEMKEAYFYDAWCTLEKVDNNLQCLERHFDLNVDKNDSCGLAFIKKHTEQFQKLFPYEVFFSPGILVLEQVCSICKKLVSPRQHCGHRVGEIYKGEMCGRIKTKVELVELSFVEDPVQKYSVLFPNDETGTLTDNYNYCHVDYVIKRLKHPFASWDMNWVTLHLPFSEIGNPGRNENCPCGSHKKFKKCCLKKGYLERKHLNVNFSEGLPSDLPAYVENNIVKGKRIPKVSIPVEGFRENKNSYTVPIFSPSHM